MDALHPDKLARLRVGHRDAVGYHGAVVVENAANRALSRGLAWIYMPVEGVAEYTTDLSDTKQVIDNLGNRQLVLAFDEVPKGFNQTLSALITPSENDGLQVAHCTAPAHRAQRSRE